MSQYRDDRDAARRRIDALEARLAEREAELTRRGTELADRDEEIARLQRELVLAGGLGPRRRRSVNAAFASRIVGAATGLAIVAAGAGVVMVRSSASALPVQAVTEADAPASPIHADPLVGGAVDWEDQVAEPSASSAPSSPPQWPAEVRRAIEPKVWGGRATEDDIRLLQALCAHDGDRACRERARAALERARARDR